MKFLDENNSTYSQPFQQLQKEVQQAKDEANDVSKYLDTLKPRLEPLLDTTTDFEEIDTCFEPIM